jgi:hypothetical protein
VRFEQCCGAGAGEQILEYPLVLKRPGIGFLHASIAAFYWDNASIQIFRTLNTECVHSRIRATKEQATRICAFIHASISPIASTPRSAILAPPEMELTVAISNPFHFFRGESQVLYFDSDSLETGGRKSLSSPSPWPRVMQEGCRGEVQLHTGTGYP